MGFLLVTNVPELITQIGQIQDYPLLPKGHNGSVCGAVRILAPLFYYIIDGFLQDYISNTNTLKFEDLQIMPQIKFSRASLFS